MQCRELNPGLCFVHGGQALQHLRSSLAPTGNFMKMGEKWKNGSAKANMCRVHVDEMTVVKI